MKPIERALGHKVTSATPISGGGISNSQRVETSAGVYFCKLANKPTSIFREEVASLIALNESGTLRIPHVLHADESCLILEWIEPGEPDKNFFRNFGATLAKLHRQSRSDFGFTADNHIGHTPQQNPRRSAKEISWAEYFLEYRLKPMVGHKTLSVDSLLQVEFQKAMPKIREALSAVKEPPSLVHGDLWSGNFMCDREGRAVLIDPACYWGHREVDLAMSELFGGFAPDFYQAYKKEFPLAPGYEVRKSIYNLYHVFNHWILFGGGYREQSIQTLQKL